MPMTQGQIRAYAQELIQSTDTLHLSVGYTIMHFTDTLHLSAEEILYRLIRAQLLYNGSELRSYLAIVEKIEGV